MNLITTSTSGESAKRKYPIFDAHLRSMHTLYCKGSNNLPPSNKKASKIFVLQNESLKNSTSCYLHTKSLRPRKFSLDQ